MGKIKDIGGQAVIEGVMMKTRRGWVVAVRDPMGEIHIKRERLPKPPWILRLPLLRGIVALYYALSLGIKALGYSADMAYEDGNGHKAADSDKKGGHATLEGGYAPGDRPTGRSDIGPTGRSDIEATAPGGKGATMALTVAFSIVLSIGLFLLLPLYATKLVGIVLPRVADEAFFFNLVDGLIRVAVFLLYIVLIGLWGEIRRIFQYHGAEHKVIHAYEQDKRLEVGVIKDMSPLHPRCGTSFLLIVMLVSIAVFSFVPQPWPFLYKFLSRLVLIPLIAGISYETLKASARMKDNPIVRLFVMPGLFLQRLTTREPDDAQIEVALRSLTEALALESEQEK